MSIESKVVVSFIDAVERGSKTVEAFSKDILARACKMSFVELDLAKIAVSKSSLSSRYKNQAMRAIACASIGAVDAWHLCRPHLLMTETFITSAKAVDFHKTICKPDYAFTYVKDNGEVKPIKSKDLNQGEMRRVYHTDHGKITEKEQRDKLKQKLSVSHEKDPNGLYFDVDSGILVDNGKTWEFRLKSHEDGYALKIRIPSSQLKSLGIAQGVA